MGRILSTYLFPHPPMIIPEIGRGQEEGARDTIEGVKALSRDIKDKSPDTIIVITPHGPVFSDAIAVSIEESLQGDFGNFGFRNISLRFENNLDMTNKIIKRANKQGVIIAEIDEAFAKDYNISNKVDHGVLVPLYFVDELYKDYKLIHITYGGLPPVELYKFGKIIQETIADFDEDVVIIASGDLSHKLKEDGLYPYSPDGKKFDEKIVNILKEGNMEEIITFDLDLSERAGECGLRSLMIMAGTLDNLKFDSYVLSYEGPYGVGYANAKFEVVGENEENNLIDKINQINKSQLDNIRNKEDDYVRLARKSLEHYIKHGEYLTLPGDISGELLNEKKAVFVTLNKEGALRGCIGTTEPVQENIAMEVIRNAVSAGTKDPRFPKVGQDELKEITYSVDVLSEPESISSMDELDIYKYGVIVEKGFRKGLLLPNIEGVNTVEEQVSIALNKAGISENENYTMERFKVVRHK